MTGPEYTPPEVWVWDKDDSPKWRYGNVNRPIAGATHEKELARGKHPAELYSLATPNGVKVTVMLEELLAAGYSGAEYDAWLIRIATAPAGRLKDNCTSAMTPAISRPKRKDKIGARG